MSTRFLRSRSQNTDGRRSMEQLEQDDADPIPGTHPPDSIVVTWISAQLRDRHQRNAAALSDMLRLRLGRQLHVLPMDRQLDDLEAEP